MRVAFATDNGNSFIKRHFGDANYFDIYEISDNKCNFIERLTNTSKRVKEEVHADPQKAGAVAQILKDKDVKVVVGKIFGPNIKRIKKKFVCAIVEYDSIEDTLSHLREDMDRINSEWKKGKERKYLVLKKMQK